MKDIKKYPYTCQECLVKLEDLFDHDPTCQTGKDEVILWCHDDYVECLECLKEFEEFMGPCPTHGSPDFPHAISELHRWKDLLVKARFLVAQGIRKTPMLNTWTEDCQKFLVESASDAIVRIPNMDVGFFYAPYIPEFLTKGEHPNDNAQQPAAN